MSEIKAGDRVYKAMATMVGGVRDEQGDHRIGHGYRTRVEIQSGVVVETLGCLAVIVEKSDIKIPIDECGHLAWRVVERSVDYMPGRDVACLDTISGWFPSKAAAVDSVFDAEVATILREKSEVMARVDPFGKLSKKDDGPLFI